VTTYAPGVAAGCTFVLGSVLFAEAVEEAGLPPGVVKNGPVITGPFFLLRSRADE
jgi:hypothetical protein